MSCVIRAKSDLEGPMIFGAAASGMRQKNQLADDNT